MTVCGLDLGPNLTGFCVGDGSARPSCGAWRFGETGEDYGRMGSSLWNGLAGMLRETQIGMVVYESPLLLPGRDKLSTLRKLYGLGVVLETWCHKHSIPCREVSHQRVKKELTGDAKASKERMVEMAKRIGIALPKNKADGIEDAADAAGVWLIGLRLYGSKHWSQEWDKRIWKPRGLLV